jgi:hypothetical protein
MKRLAGQAGRTIGYLVHHTGMLLLTVFLALALALGGLGYRLSQGPLQIPWITSRLANIVSGRGVDIHITRAALAWGGFKSGGGVPLYLQLGDITARNAAGLPLATIASAQLIFFPSALLGSQAPILVASTDALFTGATVPVSMVASIRLGGFFKLAEADLRISLGAGRLGPTGSDIPIAAGGFDADITPTAVALTHGKLTLAPVGGSAPVLAFAGNARLDQSWHGSLNLTGNGVQAADLAAYWPPLLADQARAWVTRNITAGSASNPQFSFGLSAPPNLATLSLDSAAGSFAATGLAVGWIPGAAPITDVTGTFTLTNKDVIDIAADSGALGGIALSAAHMTISGLTRPDQTAALNIPLTAGVADALKLLNAAPLNFLQGAPDAFLLATGNLAGSITAHFPLKGDLKIQQVDLLVDISMRDVTVPTPLAGLGFSKGTLHLRATTTRLDAAGTAELAGQAAQLAATATFGEAGPAIDISLKTIAGNLLLRQFGLQADPADPEGISGSVPLSAALRQSPAGAGRVTLDADLTKSAIAIPAFGWSKPAGAPGRLNITAALAQQQLAAITNITATAPGLDISGASDPGNGSRLALSRLHIGGTDANGTITAPAAAGAPWHISLAGPSLDITAILKPPTTAGKPATAAPAPKAAPAAKPAPPAGPLWVAKLNFSSFLLAAHHAPALQNLTFTGDGQGADIFNAYATASGAGGQNVTLTLSRTKAREALHLETDDGGYLLRALGAFQDLQGGALALDAAYTNPASSSGLLTLKRFRVLQAPVFGKILQGLTIYGVAEATSGPGLEFDHLIAPFAIDNGVLNLTGARAFSSSLGFTASGTVQLDTGETALDTTIVPAYAINAALGSLPVVGQLFSAEKGGGLFALRANITGQLTDPKISINPLSALTPGFLRDIFGLGEKPPP